MGCVVVVAPCVEDVASDLTEMSCAVMVSCGVVASCVVVVFCVVVPCWVASCWVVSCAVVSRFVVSCVVLVSCWVVSCAVVVVQNSVVDSGMTLTSVVACGVRVGWSFCMSVATCFEIHCAVKSCGLVVLGGAQLKLCCCCCCC